MALSNDPRNVYDEITSDEERSKDPLVAVRLLGSGPAWAAVIVIGCISALVALAFKEAPPPVHFIGSITGVSLAGLIAVVRCKR